MSAPVSPVMVRLSRLPRPSEERCTATVSVAIEILLPTPRNMGGDREDKRQSARSVAQIGRNPEESRPGKSEGVAPQWLEDPPLIRRVYCSAPRESMTNRAHDAQIRPLS